MILVVDIGNSNVVFGLYKGMDNVKVWRTETVRNQTLQYYKVKLTEYFLESDIDPSSIEAIVLSCVVPDLTHLFEELLREVNRVPFITLNRHIYDRLEVSTINPFEMGTDLMANAIAAHSLWKEDTIIVDFGTALTFTLVKKSGEIGGVNIVPGIRTAIKALSSNAAQLHSVPLEEPENIIGKTTIEAIQAGVIIGYKGLVSHMIQTIKSSLNGSCKTIATGGLSSVISGLEFDLIERNLTINGLAWIGNNLLL